MSESQSVLGMDIQVNIGDGLSPEGFTLVGEAHDVDGPEITQEFADCTHQQSTGGFRERKASFKSSGQVTFECARLKTDPGQVALIAAATAVPTTKKHFTLTYPDASIISFSAYPSVKFGGRMGQILTMNVTLSLEGAFTVT